MNQSQLTRRMMAAAVLIFAGCGTNSFQPVGQQRAGASAEAGVIAIRPENGTKPTASNGDSDLVRRMKEDPVYKKGMAEANANLAKSTAEVEQARRDYEATKAQLAALTEQDTDPTLEELLEDRRQHPASQVWTVLSNMKVSQKPSNLAEVSVDYRLICGTPRKFDFYNLRVYMLGPDEKQISEDTKMSNLPVKLADKTGGTLNLKLFENGIEDVAKYRLMAMVVQGISPSYHRLNSHLVSGILTPETPSTTATPPALLAALVGEEARGKLVILAPPPRIDYVPLLPDLNVTYEFQTMDDQSPVNRFRLVIEPPNSREIIFDITRDITQATPYVRTPLALQAGPFNPGLERPLRIHIQRNENDDKGWQPVSNVILQQ